MTVETDRLRRTKIVQAGSGFLSQHSKELLFGLGASRRVIEADRRVAERRARRSSPTCPSNHRLRIEEGGEPAARAVPDGAGLAGRDAAAASRVDAAAERDLALRAVSRARLLAPRPRRRAALALRPARAARAIVLFWATAATAIARGPRGARPRAPTPSPGPASARSPSPSTRPTDLPKVRAAAAGVATLPVVLASEEVGRSYAILNRHLFMNRQDLRLPTAFLLDAEGESRQGVPRPRGRGRDPARTSRGSRRLRPSVSRAPCRSRGRSTPRPARATTFPTAGSCWIRVSRPRPSSPSSGPRRRARAPRPSTASARCS